MNLFIIYLIVINIVGFAAMYDDKKRAIKKQWRISEATLISIAIIGGGLGVLAGIHTFRHKTKHVKFSFGVPVIILAQITIFVMLNR